MVTNTATIRVTSQQVGAYYDQMAHYYHLIWEANLHGGYWYPDEPDAPFSVAQENLTDIMISQTPVGPGKRVLDVGCGFGRPAVRLAEKTGCDVLGITVSQEQVTEANRYAKERGLEGRVSFELIDAMHLPFDSESFDAAWAFECLFHMPDRAEVVRQIARVLRPGARFTLTDSFPRTPYTHEESELLLGGFHANSFILPDEYRSLMAESGFEVKQLVDISENNSHTYTHVIASTVQNEDALVAVYGAEFLAQMHAMGPVIERLNREKVGYFWLSAEKKTV